jgi:hypothetical protein
MLLEDLVCARVQGNDLCIDPGCHIDHEFTAPNGEVSELSEARTEGQVDERTMDDDFGTVKQVTESADFLSGGNMLNPEFDVMSSRKPFDPAV